MRSKFTIVVLALVAVLVHAAALVRHNGMVLAAATHGENIARAAKAIDRSDAAVEAAARLSAAGLTVDASAICHTDFGTEGTHDSGKAPGAGGECPVCSHVTGAAAILTSPVALLGSPAAPCAQQRAPADRRLTQLRFARPPARGPPSLRA